MKISSRLTFIHSYHKVKADPKLSILACYSVVDNNKLHILKYLRQFQFQYLPLLEAFWLIMSLKMSISQFQLTILDTPFFLKMKFQNVNLHLCVI